MRTIAKCTKMKNGRAKRAKPRFLFLVMQMYDNVVAVVVVIA